MSEVSHKVDPQKDVYTHAAQHFNPLADLNTTNIADFHSLILSNDTNQYPFRTDFTPDFWVLVFRLTAGTVSMYVGQGLAAQSFRLDRGTIVVPFRSDSFTAVTSGASGFFDLYAVRELDGFKVEA